MQTLHLPLSIRRNSPFTAALLVALLLHAAALLWLGPAQMWTPATEQDAPRTVFRFVDAPERTPPPAAKAKETPPLGPAAHTRSQRTHSASQQAASAAQTPRAASDTAAPTAPSTEAQAEAGESPKPFPLAGDVMRQAAKTSARQTTLAERAAQDLGAQSSSPLSAAARLEQGIKSAGRGDCAKGEFYGGNLGLFSAPMLAFALAKGECSR
ncbi:hypothetical protein [Rhodoferax aquaticus]|uniref:Uncharacterized protein n=1 Tax=Rhodoferax aquaticus TaxID=2527691 RepID=A0A515EMH4_9BURK|nr:hypothetical protein [Rhodoferax aquaticus]QDL53863.1 hypothetical protein EXZ61_06590 [Rhodoferax aquaticus]